MKCLNGQHLDRLEAKCEKGCVLCGIPAIFLLLFAICAFGIHKSPATMTKADHYMSYAMFFLSGMTMAFNMARKWVKNWER